MGDYWEGTYQYMDWLQLFDVVLFYIIFLIATLLLLGGFELAAIYTSFREELVDKRNLPSLLSSGLNKVGGFTACLDRVCVGLRKCRCPTMVEISCCPVQREPGFAGYGGDASASIVALADRGQVAGKQAQSGCGFLHSGLYLVGTEHLGGVLSGRICGSPAAPARRGPWVGSLIFRELPGWMHDHKGAAAQVIPGCSLLL